MFTRYKGTEAQSSSGQIRKSKVSTLSFRILSEAPSEIWERRIYRIKPQIERDSKVVRW